MAYLDVLKRLGVTPSKGRGQNFLIDASAIATVLEFAHVSRSENVVEVGPGLGAISDGLRTDKLTLIELEPLFAEELKKRGFKDVIQGNALEVDLATLGPEITLVSNVPYSISTDFTMWLFRNSRSLKRASLLFQREFSARLAAEPGSRSYNSLTVLRARYCTAELGPVIPRQAFYPEPAVESQLIALDFTSAEIQLGELCADDFEKFVRTAFSQKRKTLSNTLLPLFNSKEEIYRFLEQNGLSRTTRAEEIPPQGFVELSRKLRFRE
jgi:16S rRNA (adenine1518-N6/adenine1519-N6)-dimethyltransferase